MVIEKCLSIRSCVQSAGMHHSSEAAFCTALPRKNFTFVGCEVAQAFI